MKKLGIIVIFPFLLNGLTAQQNNIFINEFLASNVSVNADIIDFDDYSDWIELYNDESFDVDISGYFITDNPNNPFKWEFPPETFIKAKGYLLIWADSYDYIPGRHPTRPWMYCDGSVIYFETNYYHLNFNLSRAGEYIGLYRADGTIVDSVTYNMQYRDVSMGRKPDGSANWYFFGEPTPEASNSTKGVIIPELTGEVKINVESGFYTDSVSVDLYTSSPDVNIKYTLDGSKPVSTSISYEDPINITKTTVIRARQLEENKISGNISNRTYFINESISLPVISIITNPRVLWNDTFGIYVNQFKEREIPISFEYFPINNESAIRLNAGLRLTGQASLCYPQISFTITARDRYGADEINYQIFPERELNNFKSLYLRNAGVPDNRNTFFRDALQHTLVLNKIDIDCQAYKPSVVFINGEYWGIYNIRDKINSDYIASLHNLNPDDIDLLEYEGIKTPTIMNGNADNYNKFYNYINSTDLSIEENYRFIETWMDIDEYINYQICEIYYDNVFWPDQNIRMWRERKENGKWRWILYDTDFGFGMPNQISSGYTNNTLKFATSSGTGISAPEWSTLIFRKLLMNNEFKVKFIQRFACYMNSIFFPDTVISTINRLQNKLSPEMSRHIERWKDGEPYYGSPIPNYSTWVINVDVMKNFAKNRPYHQRQHIIDYFGLSGSSVLEINIENVGMGHIRINNAEWIETNTSGIYFKDIPLELEAVPNVGYQFIGWKGEVNDSKNILNIILSNDTAYLTAVFKPVSINIIPSVISSDTTLYKDNSPYYAMDDIIVDSNVTLTIENGVEILMPEKACMIVYGCLNIEGTEEDPVMITPNEYAENWGALCFINSTDSSIISNLIIKKATKGRDFTRDKGAISGYNADFSIQNVTVENVKAPVFVQYGNVFISGCKLYTNVAGDLINIKYAESVTVENCNLMGNDEFDSDAIDYDQLSNGIIRGNRIYNFYGTNSDAIDLGEGSKDILIENNIIYNINDKGVSIGKGSTALIHRNIIINCGQGVGIKDDGSYGNIMHNTFYANYYGVASFEKNIGIGGGDADIINCIFANNSVSAVYRDHLSEAEVSYSLTNTDFPNGSHLIYGEPLFMNNLYISENSPAINTGDPALPNDPDGSLPDLGAYPFDPLKQINFVINEIHYNPVEGAAHQFVEIVNTGSSAVNINGYQLKGNISYTFPDITINTGEIFVIAKDITIYNGQGYKVFQWNKGDLQDVPGSIVLENNEGEILDFVDYHSKYFWPKEPNGYGPSLELHHSAFENMASNSWRSSYSDGGTPGKSNNSILITGIYINEFMAGNSSVYSDNFGEYDDWIELYNSTDKPVNVGGLYITDNLDNPVKHQIPMHSPELTTIPAKGFLLFWADRQPNQGILHLNFLLDIFGEQIGLAQALDDDTVFIDSLTYTMQTADISFGRYTDGSDNWFTFNIPTPMQSNKLTTSIIDNEYLTEDIILHQNYPNPFRTKTKINYSLPVNVETEICIYDITGRKISTLVKEKQPAGRHEAEWDASGMKPGIYLCEMKFLGNRKIIKMILIRN